MRVEKKQVAFKTLDSQDSLVQNWDDEMGKLQDELIVTSCRVAATAFTIEEIDDSTNVSGFWSGDSTNVVNKAKDTIDALKESTRNTLLIAEEVLTALSKVQQRIHSSRTIDDTEKQRLLADVDIQLYEDVLRPLFDEDYDCVDEDSFIED